MEKRSFDYELIVTGDATNLLLQVKDLSTEQFVEGSWHVGGHSKTARFRSYNNHVHTIRALLEGRILVSDQTRDLIFIATGYNNHQPQPAIVQKDVA